MGVYGSPELPPRIIEKSSSQCVNISKSTCRVCGEYVDGITCPRCFTRHKVVKKNTWKTLVIGVLAVAVLGLGYYVYTSDAVVTNTPSVPDVYSASVVNDDAAETTIENMQDYKQSCIQYSYEDISRNPQKYKGMPYTYTGTVFQIIRETENHVYLRVSLFDNKEDLFVEYTRSPEEPRILENDNITVYGELNGMISLEDMRGVQITVPHVLMRYYESK